MLLTGWKPCTAAGISSAFCDVESGNEHTMPVFNVTFKVSKGAPQRLRVSRDCFEPQTL